jgi:Fe-S-cluster containining protein
MADTWTEITQGRRAHIVRWLRAVGSRASVAKAEIWLGEQPAYVHIAGRWDGMDAEQRAVASQDLVALFRAAAYATRPFCVRCGDCCKNAGPTLFAGDEAVLHEGHVSHAMLRTLRAGEEVWSHQVGERVVLEREIVMISPALAGNCPLYDMGSHTCTAYDVRPAQCRAQKCWDTSDSDQLSTWSGLTRLDLLEDDDPLREVLEAHDRDASPSRMRELAEPAIDGDDDAIAEIGAMLDADRTIRHDVVARELAPQSALPFLLGRPLDMIAAALGMAIGRGWDQKVTIRRRG